MHKEPNPHLFAKSIQRRIVGSWRDTKPENMKKEDDPIGPLNSFHLLERAKAAGIVLAEWGTNGSHQGRAEQVSNDFKEAKIPLHALRKNQDGSPQHPLYVPAETQPIIL